MPGLNYILGSNIVAFSNSFALMEQAEVPLDVFTSVLSNGPLNLSGGYYPYDWHCLQFIFSVWSEKMMHRNYQPILFPTEGLQKDVTLATEEMKARGVNTATAGMILPTTSDIS